MNEEIKGTHAQTNVKELLSKLLSSDREEEKARIRALNGDEGYTVANHLQTWLDENPRDVYRRKVTRLLADMATMSAIFPNDLFVTGVKLEHNYPKFGGGCADIYLGSRPDGTMVALKRLKIFEYTTEKEKIQLHRDFCKESITWRQLKHDNILALIGIDKETFADVGALAIVSPYMERGHILNYVVSEEYSAELERLGLIRDVANGLRFLHSEGITHGDLHGSNIFITADKRACIADFGLSVVGDLTRTHQATATGTASPYYWLAPELVTFDLTFPTKTPQADVFSFGRVCLAVCTGRNPFFPMPEVGVLMGLARDHRPTRPSADLCQNYAISDQLWDTANACWNMQPAHRPSMEDVVTNLLQ